MNDVTKPKFAKDSYEVQNKPTKLMWQSTKRSLI